jgi:hypothetical protein
VTTESHTEQQSETASKLQTRADRKLQNLTNRGKGRKKGVPNVITGTLREMFAAFVEGNMPKVQGLFDRVARKQPAKALELFVRFSEFVLPRQREVSGTLASIHFDASVPISDVAEQQRILAQVFGDPNFDMSTVPQFVSPALPAAAMDAVEAIIEQPVAPASVTPDLGEPIPVTPEVGERAEPVPDPLEARIAPIEDSTVAQWARLADEPAPAAQPKETALEKRRREMREFNEQERQRQQEAGRIRAARALSQ